MLGTNARAEDSGGVPKACSSRSPARPRRRSPAARQGMNGEGCSAAPPTAGIPRAGRRRPERGGPYPLLPQDAVVAPYEILPTTAPHASLNVTAPREGRTSLHARRASHDLLARCRAARRAMCPPPPQDPINSAAIWIPPARSLHLPEIYFYPIPLVAESFDGVDVGSPVVSARERPRTDDVCAFPLQRRYPS
jgi:hypothetical protein